MTTPPVPLSDAGHHGPRLRLREDATGARHASWLELLYDLVFVVAIAELAKRLHDDPTWGGALTFAALAVPVIWSWMNVTFYADQFDTDDVPFRLSVFASMLAVLVLAGGLDDAATAFVLAYVALKVVMVLLYGRAGLAEDDPDARAFSVACVLAYGASAILWLVSLVLPEDVRPVVWALGLLIEIGTPAVGPAVFSRMQVHLNHIPERFGLFTIIVIGESVVVVALGVEDWRTAAALAAAAGLAVVCALWWLYFDPQEEVRLRPTIRPNLVYIYGHIPLLAALNAAAVGVEFGVEHAGSEPLPVEERLVLGLGLTVALLALTALQHATLDGFGGRAVARRIAATAVVLAAALVAVPSVASLGAIAVVLAALAALERRERAATAGLSAAG